MYQFKSRIRFSETDQNKKLSLQSIVDYFQDCSTFQTEELGVGFSYLEPRGLTWVLSYWQIIIDEYPALGEDISIGTLPYDFRSFMGKRNFFMEKEGKVIVKADSLWTLLDIKKLRPVKVPDLLLETYQKEEKIEMEYAPRKIAVTGKETEKEGLVVSCHHLDCNGHVNNGQYIKIAMTYLPGEFVIRQMRAEYKNQAYLGDRIRVFLYEGEGKTIICLTNEEKDPYVIIEFQY